jgi:UDP:flavonoid glycosyltransferase YjiC (YdhE family)
MRALLIPMGSAGDVYPLVGLGAALRARGHRVEVVANSYYQSAVERAGVSFVPLGSYEDIRPALENPDLWHPHKGFLILGRALLPLMRRLYAVIADRATPGETVVVASSLALAARVAQDKLGISLVTVHLQPTALRSAYDPAGAPGLLPQRWVRALRRFRDWLVDVLLLDRVFGGEINALRADLGLPPVRRPLHRWWHSPQRVLGLFPEWFAPPAPDWPEQTQLTGFPLYDDFQEVPPDVVDFLASGSPPIVFTPGSAMRHSRAFFAESVAACRLLGQRGVLLTRFPEQVPPELPDGVRHFDYLPLSRVLPCAAALVSHGGIGSVSQALAAGVPQLVMPMAFDQWPNALRLEQLGVAVSLRPKAYRAAAVAQLLMQLLTSAEVANRCRSYARKLEDRNSLAAACQAVEGLADTTQLPLRSVEMIPR